MERGTDIQKAAAILRDGGLVAFPTETVYGLGANGLNPVAVARIFEVKKRPAFDPLILHVGSPEQAAELFLYPEDRRIKALTERFWPGPLTIVAHKKSFVPDIVTSGMPTVAVRMPSHFIALQLIRAAGVPVAAPSANLFGRLSPTLPHHVQKQLTGVDYLIDGGKTQIGVESTIISLTGETATLLRPGFITLEQIREVIPVEMANSSDAEDQPLAPGLLKSHYSPEKPLTVFESLEQDPGPHAGVIFLSPASSPGSLKAHIIHLSASGDLVEAAAHLFTALHDMENNPEVDEIYIQQVEEKGIGIAIMDRVRKAAYRHME
ncbi:MAG TPA: threonylcarbamoyl-AMP synthase [Prolixibacteraceae bacterium]|nr:threonylcarbamoyl-AMP synthase [Prolixibacteraceae bacterium]